MKHKPVFMTIVKKLGQFVISVFCASILIFFIVQLTPGNIAEIHSLSPATAAGLHLDRPAWIQYLYWLLASIQLDFGVSLTDGTPVLHLLINYAGTTLVLTVGSLLLSLSVSIPIAVFLGTAPESRTGQLLTTIIYSFSSIPVFVVGYIVLAIVFGVFKFYPLDVPEGDWRFWPWMAYYVLPVIVLALGNGTLGEFVRVLSLEIRSANRSLFIKAARSRGAGLLRHFFRPVVIPFMSVVVSRFAVLISGVIVVERIFNRHGLGWLTWEATLNRDFFVIMAVVLLTALSVRLLMLLHEILAYTLDPRLRK
ncbi:ABC transporter permease [Fibrobacterota bacterium]